MLWIHGGGNTIGHGGSYNSAKLATSQDVVVVTINYRLGPMGWFSHPDLARGNPLDDSGNYGTLDVIRALEWTRDNIAKFGGDPGNVTVFGESAGAFDTLAMLASPGTCSPQCACRPSALESCPTTREESFGHRPHKRCVQ